LTDPLDGAIATLEPALRRFFERRAPSQADDLLQELRLRLERTRAQYDPMRPAEPWIWRIAWIILLEQRRVRRHAALESASEPAARADLEPSRREARQLIWTCVRDLEEGRSLARTFVVLHALEGVPHARLVERYGARESASKMRVARGLEELERRLTRDRLLWPVEKTAAALDAWELVESADPRAQHALLLALFGRIDPGLQRELGLALDEATRLVDEVGLARAQARLVAAGFPP
jgi:RNA polymerase sigma factor (sigma-70 family)